MQTKTQSNGIQVYSTTVNYGIILNIIKIMFMKALTFYTNYL